MIRKLLGRFKHLKATNQRLHILFDLLKKMRLKVDRYLIQPIVLVDYFYGESEYSG